MNRAPYLLFDLDGTLVDSVPDLTFSLNRLRSEANCPPLSQQQVGAMVGDGVKALVRRALGDKHYSQQRLARFMEIYAQHLLDNTSCFPGIEELLNNHSPERMAIITNKPYQLTIQLLEGLDLLKYFKIVVGGDSFPQKKPDPMPVLKALEGLSARPEQAIMVGDHHTDIKAGRAAGTAVCFCTYGVGHNDGLATEYTAEKATDLLTLFPGQALD
ncbi:MAG: HAD-IA family hydrolase [Deltaproteobacteria bacterium]|jgi:phosphoglycolate phosphatase|nr:HAD-IA family hydrolase [Deltaproteobacteria bacterium]